MIVSFIDVHRGMHGVEPICSALPIAPSTYVATWKGFAYVAFARTPLLAERHVEVSLSGS